MCAKINNKLEKTFRALCLGEVKRVDKPLNGSTMEA
jgi:hypothetical protein